MDFQSPHYPTMFAPHFRSERSYFSSGSSIYPYDEKEFEPGTPDDVRLFPRERQQLEATEPSRSPTRSIPIVAVEPSESELLLSEEEAAAAHRDREMYDRIFASQQQQALQEHKRPSSQPTRRYVRGSFKSTATTIHQTSSLREMAWDVMRTQEFQQPQPHRLASMLQQHYIPSPHPTLEPQLQQQFHVVSRQATPNHSFRNDPDAVSVTNSSVPGEEYWVMEGDEYWMEEQQSQEEEGIFQLDM